MLWRLVVFAETEEDHKRAWAHVCKEFGDQRAILIYLYRTYMPLRAQWARRFIRQYRNFGIRVTSGTEASNNNVKSYLLNGMSHLYRLVEAIEGMLEDQERDFLHACAQDEVLTGRQYCGQGSEYLGELPSVVSHKCLALITREYRNAMKAMPSKTHPWPEPIGSCNKDCTVSTELGIPCRHLIYTNLETSTPFTKWDVHPRWHLRQSGSTDPYRRILNPRLLQHFSGDPGTLPRLFIRAWVLPKPVKPKSSLRAANQSAAGDHQVVGIRRYLLS